MTTAAADSVLQFLRDRSGEEYCHTCLAASLNLPFEETQKAVTAQIDLKRPADRR